MNGSMTRTLAAALLMLSALSGCATWQTSSAIDRLKPAAADHAEALAGSDMPAARKTGLALLSQLAAFADW
jgi:hypothetical protein